MIVQLAVLDQYEDLLRYWILIFLFIVLAFIIARLTEFMGRRCVNDEDSTFHRETITKKRTLVHHFMNQVSLNVDIYSITFVSYFRLDEAAPKSDEGNLEPLINQNDNEQEDNQSDQDENNEIVHNTEQEANKNFSNSAFIFLI